MLIEFDSDDDKEIDEEGIGLLANFFIAGPNNDTLVPMHNIAGLLDDSMLMEIGRTVVEGYQSDLDSMCDWIDSVDAGRDLIKQERESKSEPWDGAANFKSPIIMNASLKFSDRASTELLRNRNIAKVNTQGDDQDKTKAERARRVEDFLNYQLNVEMEEWRCEHEKMLYDLPYTGTAFKKTYFDSRLGRNVSDLITYPNFAVDNDAHSIDRLRRFSEKLPEFTGSEIVERVRQGLWIDPELTPDGEDVTCDTFEFIEQQGFFDIDEDGYEEPYTFVVHEATSRVVRITPRFEASDVLIKDDKNRRATTLDQLIQLNDFGDREIIRIKPTNNITKYGFIRDPQGGFLDVGYFHLIGSINAGVNLLTNDLLNSGTLSNLQGGFTAKDFRRRNGPIQFRPGEYVPTNMSPEELQTSIRDHSFKEPSPTLLQMVQLMTASANELTASADLKGALSANAPATTTLALVQEQQQSAGAIILRIYRSMSKEFGKLYELNSQFLDPLEYQMFLDNPAADFAKDFNVRDMDIVPVANPEVSSKIQRLQQAQVEISQLQAVMLAGGDIKPIIRNFYEAIGSENIDEIFPELTPDQRLQQLLTENPDLMSMITEEQERLDLIAASQADAIEREQLRQDMELQSKIAKEESETLKNQSATLLNLEKAETEDLNNAVSTYTTAVNLDQQAQQQIIPTQQTQ